jgi:hypothetical protein
LFRRTWQSPSNAHAYRLYVVNDPARTSSVALSFLAVFAAISEALDYDRFFRVPSNSAIFFRPPTEQSAAAGVVGEDSHCSTLFALSSRLNQEH